MIFSKLAIIGPGLLGGSIAFAAAARESGGRIAIWARREEAVQKILERRLATDASTDLAEVVTGADLLVLCVPIGAMPGLVENLQPFLLPSAVVTDVGSVKAAVVRDLEQRLGGRFVGSHPMAGSEQTGLGAARADLFEAAVSIVTPTAATDSVALEKVERFWRWLGCEVKSLQPEEHDRVIAQVSHLPHLLAAVLVNLVCAEGQKPLQFCGNGFRDATRVASGSAQMWAEIFATNRVAVKESVLALMAKLQEAVEHLEDADAAKMEQFLTDAKKERDGLRRVQMNG